MNSPVTGDTQPVTATADDAAGQETYRREPRWANQRLGLVVVIGLLIVVFGALKPVFFDERLVMFPLLTDVAIYTVVAMSQMVVLSIGHMNLAVGRMAAFSAMFAGMSFDLWGLPFYLGMVIGLVAGAAVGALAGLVIAMMRVNSFVVTLAMDFTLLGLIPLVYARYTEAAAFTTKPPGMAELRQYSMADVCVGDVCGSPAIPQMLLLTLVAMALVGWLYRRAKLGREILMTGANVRAAELSGIPTARRIVFVHALSGTLAGLAGFMLAVDTGSFKASIGTDFLLPSFLGAILGGTLLVGGVVSIIGAALGTTLVLVIRRGLDLLGIGLESLNIYLGVILLLAVSTERVRSMLFRAGGGTR
ncbi:ABC transporter permease [Jiangella alba]|uniref:Monosaccharide ABC transporter membrane protein, CUT2 family n=1 Tax=Jiangella alba TaxID=561176 RepID=A0A1H5JAK3_9ACTN|nr:ABC transporter permease [Jiangella alba]SEE49277.1 monosaccharide ABC transporter membrane protein, CUT2 family [Jiangella alba]